MSSYEWEEQEPEPVLCPDDDGAIEMVQLIPPQRGHNYDEPEQTAEDIRSRWEEEGY